jgi:acetoin utilization deacetylase AcuC-like enzyme
MNVYFSPAYTGAAYAFETTRKAGWVADSLASQAIEGVTLVSPKAATPAQLCRVHDPAYVQAVMTGTPLALAESQGFTWDAGLAPMVQASNGGVIAAALDAMRHGVSGSLSSGLHHARREAGAGYCTFNGLVLAAREALDAGARKVLIVDLDAHCGGGTASLLAGEPDIWQLDISVDRYDTYDVQGRTILRMVQTAGDYLHAVRAGLHEVQEQWPRFDLCLYNAGMDPFEGCSDGGMSGIDAAMLAERDHIVFDWCRKNALPVSFALAGGYVGEQLDAGGLVQLHRLTLCAAAAASFALAASAVAQRDSAG